MIVTPANLAAIYNVFDARFAAAFEATPAWSEQLITEFPSATRQTTYAWMERVPRFREWVGERVVKNLAARSYVLANKDYEDTIELPRNDIEDDTFGTFAPYVDAMGQSAAKWRDDVMATVIQAGVSSLAYDGQFFWDTDHPVDMDNAASGVYANLYTGTALNATNFQTVRAAMGSILGVDGRPLRVMPRLLVVPPQLEGTARAILNAEIIAPTVAGFGNAANVAVSNVNRGAADLLVVPELANEATVWYLLDNSKAIRPFIFQNRRAPTFTFLNAPTDENVFWHKSFVYGGDARGNGGYSLPFLAARCIA